MRGNIHANIACPVVNVYTFALLAGLDRAGLVLSRSEKFVYPRRQQEAIFSDWQGGCRSCCPPSLPSAIFGNIRRRFLLPVKKRAVAVSLGNYRSARRRTQARRLRCLSTYSTYSTYTFSDSPETLILCGFADMGRVQNSDSLGTKLR